MFGSLPTPTPGALVPFAEERNPYPERPTMLSEYPQRVTVSPVFGLRHLVECGPLLQRAGQGASSVEEAARVVVDTLREWFVDKEFDQPALPLVRFYLTSRWADLEPDLKDFAMAHGNDAFIGPDVTCLTLLATAGEEVAWNDRHRSAAHKAIPLPSVEALRRLPMVARMVDQLGVDPHHLVAPNEAVAEAVAERVYDVFLVAEALGSPYVPDQTNFVIPYGIRSVIGMGGVLPGGALFCVLMFSSVPIASGLDTAFATLSLSVKVALLPLVGGAVFVGASGGRQRRTQLAAAVVEATNTTLLQLLDARAFAVDTELRRVEQAASDADRRASELAASEAALKLSEARNRAVVDGALDCIVGMDSDGRITDFNPAAETTFGYTADEVIGQPLVDVLVPYNMRERHRAGLMRYLASGEGPVLGRRIEVQALRADGSEFPVELAITAIAGVHPALFTGYIRDISDRRSSEEELAAGRERLAHVARTLQTSLLPPELPDIDGFELASAFRALGEGNEVGGDFFDVFEIGNGRWALTLGDVCGKGSEAAVVTAMLRYTIRAAAMRTSDPSLVLGTLNEALQRQHPDQFATAAYATLDPSSGALRVGLGGHPHPLLLTAEGDVRRIGVGGLLLGPFAEWQASSQMVTMEAGDLVLLYSDGVTEARRSGELFGEERLVEVLRASAKLTVDEVVHRVEAAVVAFAPALTDDLAMLALRRNPSDNAR